MHVISTLIAGALTAVTGAVVVGFATFCFVVLFRSQEEAAASVIHAVGNAIVAGAAGFLIGAVAIQFVSMWSYLKGFGFTLAILAGLCVIGVGVLDRLR